MHNTLNRLQNVFGYFTTVAAVLACAIALESLLATRLAPLKDTALTLNNIQVVKGRPNYASSKREEFAHIKFDLDIDLSSLFSWNTKQVFLYITATYPSTTPGTAPSQSVVWDAILPHPLALAHENTYIYPGTKRSRSKTKSKSKSKAKDSKPAPQQPVPGLLKLDAQRPKYQITDVSGRLAERTNASLELNYNIQPFVGALQWVTAPSRAPAPSRSWVSALLSWLSAWRTIASRGVRTAPFDFPPLKDRAEAARAAGKEGLGTERGGEGNRGRPA